MKKWLIGISLLLLGLSASTALFVDYQLDKMFGGHTLVANSELHTSEQQRIAITNIHVLSPDASKFIQDQTVLIENGLIQYVGPSIQLSPETVIISGRNKYLIPGLIDSHVHLWQSKNDLLLYIANGVTQVREMNGSEEHLQWRAEIDAGGVGPDLFVVAPQFSAFEGFMGPFNAWTQRKTNVRSFEDVELKVSEFKSQGFDAVKVSSFLDKPGHIALNSLSREYSIPLVGHIPQSVELDDLWGSNQTEIAHIEELMKALDREFGGYSSNNTREFLKYVEERSQDLARELFSNGIAVTSTLALMNSFPVQKSDLSSLLRDNSIRFANPGITEGTVITSRGMGWLPEVNIYRWPDDITEEQKDNSLSYWNAYSAAQQILLKAFDRENVILLVGTDANVPVMVPRFSIHQELAELSNAGMSNSRALAAATKAPAEWMKTNTGQITEQYQADLVILEENPLKDISATRSIDTVIVDGRIYSREHLNELLKLVSDANDESRTTPLKSLY